MGTNRERKRACKRGEVYDQDLLQGAVAGCSEVAFDDLAIENFPIAVRITGIEIFSGSNYFPPFRPLSSRSYSVVTASQEYR